MVAFRLLALVLFGVLLAGCSPHKRTLEEAASLRNAGMHRDAFNRYLSIYQADPSVTEALIGLRDAGSVVTSRLFSEVQMLQGQGNFNAALSALDEAERFVNEYKWLELRAPFFAGGMREELLNAIARDNYTKAEDAVRREQWDEAREYLKVARRYNRNMEEIEYLDRIIRVMPDFRKGQKAMELRLYQEAYAYFEKVSLIDADFNGVLERMDECIEQGRIDVTVIPIARKSVELSPTERAMVTSIKQRILEAENPFVRLVARDDLDVLLEEQRNSMSGIFDQSAVIEAGRLIGAEYLILAELLRYDINTQTLRDVRQKGYLGRNILARKVEYREIETKRSYDAVFRFYLVKSETGEVLAAETIPLYEEETLHWAEFEGDHTSLHPGNWNHTGAPSLQDKVFTDQKWTLDRLLAAERNHTPTGGFERRFIELVSVETARKVNEYATDRRIVN